MSFRACYSPPRQEHLDAEFLENTCSESEPSALGAFDVIITGVVCPMEKNTFHISFVRQTEDRHAAAWGGYRYMGRIRPSDGLIVLLREPVRNASML
jgi:hypothetical protein